MPVVPIEFVDVHPLPQVTIPLLPTRPGQSVRGRKELPRAGHVWALRRLEITTFLPPGHIRVFCSPAGEVQRGTYLHRKERGAEVMTAQERSCSPACSRDFRENKAQQDAHSCLNRHRPETTQRVIFDNRTWGAALTSRKEVYGRAMRNA